MKSIVFLSYEGVTDTIFESQVLEHCIRFPDIHLFLLPTNIQAYNKSISFIDKSNHCLKISVLKSCSQKIPFSELINAIHLYLAFKKNKITNPVIHARSDYAAAVANLLKLVLDCNVIWDCRGDTVSEQELAYDEDRYSVLKLMRLVAIKCRIYIANTFSDNIILVSTALRNKLANNKKNTFIIPCCSNNKKFFYNEALRIRIRKELNISDDTKVFIYSGSTLGKYHIFNKTAELFSVLEKKYRRTLFIILTPNIEEAKCELLDFNINNYILKTASLDEVNGYLNAADYGVILRDKSNVNFVSSPVKFSEYALTGLKIITTENIYQAKELLSVWGNIYMCDLDRIANFEIDELSNDRHLFANDAAEFFDRDSYQHIYSYLYSIGKID